MTWVTGPRPAARSAAAWGRCRACEVLALPATAVGRTRPDLGELPA
jgi:hypothetical protein